MAEELTPRDAPFPPLRYVLPGLLLPPLAWLVQMVMTETLAAQSCYPFNEPLSAPVVPWMRPALVVISALCFVVGGLGSVIAWRNLRRIGGSKQGAALSGARRTRAELAGFLSRIAAMCSVLFLFALIATDVALAIVSPCRWW